MNRNLRELFGPFVLTLIESSLGFTVTLLGNGAKPQSELLDLYPEACKCFYILKDALRYITDHQSKTEVSQANSGVRCSVCYELTDPKLAARVDNRYVGNECLNGRFRMTRRS